jgi:predicted phage tail protein
MNPEVTKIGNKLFNKVELSSQKVELAKSLTDILTAYQKGLDLNKKFDTTKSQYDTITNQLANIADDFVSSYIVVVNDGKETLKAIMDLGISGAEVNNLKNAISEMSGLRTKIGNPTDWKPRK